MPGRHVYAFDDPVPVTPDERPRLIGGKGANLAVMSTDLGLPVPPGFTITTDACRSALGGAWPDGLDDEVRAQMTRLEERIGRRFGDTGDPLLVSVRSGAPVSMPGMMDTILNLGLTEATAAGLAATTGDAAFAADCLRRFGEGYRAVLGSPEVPDDPWEQLRGAIDAVFRSWNSDRAVAYRRHEGISDDLGTAVTVQAMVFGNRDASSGTGVVFTRDPSTGEAALYGDILFQAQGEDVVAGTHETRPIAELEERLPEVGAQLRRHAATLEHHYADLCDIEFTIESGRLWMLQVRVGKRSPGAALRMAVEMAEDPDFPLSREEAVRRVAHLLAEPPTTFVPDAELPEPIASGLPASPGFATGEIATSADAARVAADDGRPVILVRSETSPEDVGGMARSAGVLTARGGLASHAAVVARGWGIPAVVGAGDVRPGDGRVEIGERSFRAGDEITIDGSSGAVYAGAISGHREVAPEAATLLDWAEELGIAVASPAAAAPTTATDGDAHEGPDLDGDDVLRALLVRGAVTVEQLADGLLAGVEDVTAQLDRLGADRLVEARDGSAKLSAEGRLRALEVIAVDRSMIGETAAGELLEAFHAFDGRMKEIVTAWQIRDVDGEQVLNDHADAAYDAAVLDDLATLHAETASWLDALTPLARFARYRARLGRALEAARGGDQRFVASPRVDSYHGAWFELHEELIRLAGRQRADEAAAGRA